MQLHNRKFYKPLRKHLRNHSTAAEATLWKMLKKRQVGGINSCGNILLENILLISFVTN